MQTGASASSRRGHDIVVRLRGISKRFGATQALSEVDLDVRRGAVHCLLGENGAGKSTIGKILAGMYPPDSGAVEIAGEAVEFSGIRSARRHGVGCVFQELSLAPDLSVQDNICLGAEHRFALAAPRQKVEGARCLQLLTQLGLAVSLGDKVGSLPIAQQQLIEVAKALYRQSSIIVLDEPTAMLGATEVQKLFDIVRALKNEGTTFIFITHHLDEVRALGDCVSVLRDGKLVETFDLDDKLSDSEIISRVTGPLGEAPARVPVAACGEEVFRLESPDPTRLSVRRGEIVGLYGVAGCGREGVVSAITGLGPNADYSMQLFGGDYRPRSPVQASRSGVGYLPSGRAANSVLHSRSIRENLMLTQLESLHRFGLIKTRTETERLNVQLSRLRTKFADASDSIGCLSGGNQQKIFLSRCLHGHDRRMVVLEDPSAGVDIAAKRDLHSLILEYATQGGSVLLVSSDLTETLGLCRRIYTMFDGCFINEYEDASDADRENIIADVLGGRNPAAAHKVENQESTCPA